MDLISLSVYQLVPMGFSVGSKPLKGKVIQCSHGISLRHSLLKAAGAQGAKIASEGCPDVV